MVRSHTVTTVLLAWDPPQVKSYPTHPTKDPQLQSHLDIQLFGGDLWERISNDSAMNAVHISYPSHYCIALKS